MKVVFFVPLSWLIITPSGNATNSQIYFSKSMLLLYFLPL